MSHLTFYLPYKVQYTATFCPRVAIAKTCKNITWHSVSEVSRPLAQGSSAWRRNFSCYINISCRYITWLIPFVYFERATCCRYFWLVCWSQLRCFPCLSGGCGTLCLTQANYSVRYPVLLPCRLLEMFTKFYVMTVSRPLLFFQHIDETISQNGNRSFGFVAGEMGENLRRYLPDFCNAICWYFSFNTRSNWGIHFRLLISIKFLFWTLLDSQTIVNNSQLSDKGLEYQLLHDWLGLGLLTNSGTDWLDMLFTQIRMSS